MKPASPRQVFEDPGAYWAFLTASTDDQFEGQHFDRKLAGQPGATGTNLNNQLNDLRNGIQQTVSAFANSNVEGGLLVIGIGSDGVAHGVDHLTEKQKNSLTDFHALLQHQAAEARFHNSATGTTICLIFVPYIDNDICETPGNHPKAWVRSGPQNILMTQEVRDRIRANKGLLNFETAWCCPFIEDDLAREVLDEFRKVFHTALTTDFTDQRILYEAGAIALHNGEYWWTNAGLLFFGANPQRIFPGAHVRILRFDLVSEQFEQRGLPVFDQRFTGPITTQIRECRTFLRESAFFKRYQKRKQGGGFTEEPEYPPNTVDEALVNAVAHRDYRTGIPVECESYKDAFIVKNPGRMLQRNTDLPNTFSLSDTVLNSMPKNPKLLEWLKLMNDPDGAAYVQAISEGTKQMLREMNALDLPAPAYRLAENETLIKLVSNAEIREALMLGVDRERTTEYANLYLLRIRQGNSPASRDAFNIQYGQFMNVFRDVLSAHGWFIDRFGFSRIVAHKRGIEISIPDDLRNMLRLYPAYEFQVREYRSHFYLCLDYKCEVLNVQKLSVLARQFPSEVFLNRRCTASSNGWRDGRIIEPNNDLAKIHFFDTETDEMLPLDSVIPNLPVLLLKESLRKKNICFDLSAAIKKHSLAATAGAARERSEKISAMIEHVANTLFPIKFSDMDVALTTSPVQLAERSLPSEFVMPVHRLQEPLVEFRERHSSPDVRIGITQYGIFDSAPHDIEIVPVVLHSMRRDMEQLIERLMAGKYRYRGAERTFSTRFSYTGIVTVERAEDSLDEIQRLLNQNKGWRASSELRRIFLIHSPEEGYSLDDHLSPYYRAKRLLLEEGVPCQMVDTPTLRNPDWKDLNLALNIIAKCGITPWVLPDAIPDADFFVGLSYTQSRDGQRIMGFANVFNSYGKWEFYSGKTSYFAFEERSLHLAKLVEDTLRKLKGQLPPAPRVIFHYSAKFSKEDRDSILGAARKVRPEGTFTFVWVNSHHNVRLFDNRPETDGSLSRGSYVEAGQSRIYLSTTGYNSFRRAMGTPQPLEVSAWVRRPEELPRSEPDLRALAVQVLNLTKLNWASTDSFCGEPITLKYAGNIAYLTAAFLRQSEPFRLHPVLEVTPWFI